jgi:uncharacterized membrane protein YesL
MKLLWRVLSGAASDVVAESFLLIVFNFLWLALSLLVLPLPFAFGGMFYAAREIGERRAVGVRTFFHGGRRYAGPLYRWGALNLVVGVVVIANISFYGRLGQAYSDVLQSLFVTLASLWLLLQLYTLPALIHLKQPGLRVALQDGFFLMLRFPALSLAATLIVLLLVSVSAVMPILLVLATGALIAVLMNRVVAEELAWHQTGRELAKRHARREG